jgi:cytoskeleton protein RodZ
MSSVGKLLRSAREEQNRSLAEIAGELCITQSYLRAIEEDDLSSLPGAFFYRSFVRQYAALVGLEDRHIQSAMEALAPDSEPPAPPADTGPAPAALSPWLVESIRLLRAGPKKARAGTVRQADPLVRDFNRYFSDRRIGASLAGVTVALLACSSFYAWWTAAPPEPASVSLASSGPAVPEGSQASTPTVAIDQEMNVAVLNISATETTWLSITSAGKLIYSGILQPSQTKTLTGVEGARMKVGNAGGLEIRWKGKDIGPIGPRGQVRTVLFKTDDVEILKPAPESSAL